MHESDPTTVFAPLHARSVATGGDPLDRISVRDYMREVEIGAFTSERGVTQRIRFNVVLEVARHTAAQDDDVDKVVSYDGIIEAIETQLTAGRINLLETLAERIAETILADRRAARVFIRIEKLDRIPGALGIEIVRSRLDRDPEIRPDRQPAAVPEQPDPLILAVSRDIAHGPDFHIWTDAAAALDLPVVFCLPPLATYPPGTPARVALLSCDQMAWTLAAADPRLSVIATRTELDHAIRSPRLILWAPARMAAEAADAPSPDTLPRWLADRLGASRLIALGLTGIGETATAATPEDLTPSI